MTNFFHSRKLDDWNNEFNLRWYYSVGNISSELIPAVGWTLENLLTTCSMAIVAPFFSHIFFNLQQKRVFGGRFESPLGNVGTNDNSEKFALNLTVYWPLTLPRCQMYNQTWLMSQHTHCDVFKCLLLFRNQKSFVQLPVLFLTIVALTEKVHSCLKFIDINTNLMKSPDIWRKALRLSGCWEREQGPDLGKIAPYLTPNLGFCCEYPIIWELNVF